MINKLFIKIQIYLLKFVCVLLSIFDGSRRKD